MTVERALKFCPRCKTALARDEFGPSASRRDGLQVYCRPCMRATHKQHYERHRDRRRARIVSWNCRRRREHQLLTFAYLMQHPCIDCGESDPVVLEFDHVRGVKRTSIERLVSVGCSRATLLAELDKCTVRCANCHRRSTARIRLYARHRLALQHAAGRPAAGEKGDGGLA
jgi:hypothetical protein